MYIYKEDKDTKKCEHTSRPQEFTNTLLYSKYTYYQMYFYESDQTNVPQVCGTNFTYA